VPGPRSGSKGYSDDDRFFGIPLARLKGMSTMTATLLTADDYIATGDTRPRWTELINGEVVMNNPTVGHQVAVTFVHVELVLWTRGGPGRGTSPGQLDVKFDNGNVLAPDVLWVSEGRLPHDAAYLDFAPELVVEVRSPSTWRYDTTVKFRIYEAAGVGEVWLVDTASKSVLVYRRSSASSPDFDIALELAEGEVLTSPLLEGFALNITTLFNQRD
jgi:Uma2 family endonuclease